jgi:hypothetical protein
MERFKKFYARYEKFLIPGTLIAGTAFDFWTFKTISIGASFLLLGIYALVAGALIALTTLEKVKSKVQLAQVIIQFTFGALLSGSLVFYWFSGSLSVTWPLVLLIALLMGTNEVFRHFYLKAEVQISVFFFIIFSLFSLGLPFLFNSLSPWLFILSGALSLLLIYFYVLLLGRSSTMVQLVRHRIILSVTLIFFMMNGLYFGNIIPPIPLSLRAAGIYHSVTKVGDDYVLVGEDESWLDQLLPGQKIHMKIGETLYAYTAIFAPADLNAEIIHDWQYYDEATDEWVNQGKYSFGITGGRQDGYRGYSQKSALKPGRWQVIVETERGQILGRIGFEIIL